MGRHQSSKSRNFSRALHTLIHKKDKTLPVQLSSVLTKVKVSRRRKILMKPWPVIHLSSWLECCFGGRNYQGFFFLGGNRLVDLDVAQNMFSCFWQRYSKIDPTAAPAHPAQTIPIYLHGDEGRSLGKRPLLVISFQPVMGWLGGNCVPSRKHLCQIPFMLKRPCFLL